MLPLLLLLSTGSVAVVVVVFGQRTHFFPLLLVVVVELTAAKLIPSPLPELDRQHNTTEHSEFRLLPELGQLVARSRWTRAANRISH